MVKTYPTDGSANRYRGDFRSAQDEFRRRQGYTPPAEPDYADDVRRFHERERKDRDWMDWWLKEQERKKRELRDFAESKAARGLARKLAHASSWLDFPLKVVDWEIQAAEWAGLVNFDPAPELPDQPLWYQTSGGELSSPDWVLRFECGNWAQVPPAIPDAGGEPSNVGPGYILTHNLYSSADESGCAPGGYSGTPGLPAEPIAPDVLSVTYTDYWLYPDGSQTGNLVSVWDRNGEGGSRPPYPDADGSGTVLAPWPWPDRLEVPEPSFGEPWNQPSADPLPKHQDSPFPRVDVPLFPVPLWVFPEPGKIFDPIPAPPTQVIVVPDPGDGVDEDPAPDTGDEFAGSMSPPVDQTVIDVYPGRPRNRRPPGKGDRKVRIRGLLLAGYHVINFLTEQNDFITALWNALPRRYQRWDGPKGKAPTPYDKAKAIFTHLDQVDVAKAVENVVNNWIEDFVYGNLGRSAAAGNQLTGGQGAGTALSGPGKILQQYNPNAMDGLIPTLSFDPGTGAWSFDTPLGSIQGNLGAQVF